MFADLFLAVEIADDDVELLEVASQCGYDFNHPLVSDVAEPVVGEWHGEPCLLLRLTMDGDLSAAALENVLQTGVASLSHPSVAFFKALAIRAG